MQFTATLTLGEVMQMATMLCAVTAIIVGVRIELRAVKEQMQSLSGKLEKHETTLFSMFGQLQRVIGIVETEQRTPQR